jgi:hypothetical protein
MFCQSAKGSPQSITTELRIACAKVVRDDTARYGYVHPVGLDCSTHVGASGCLTKLRAVAGARSSAALHCNQLRPVEVWVHQETHLHGAWLSEFAVVPIPIVAVVSVIAAVSVLKEFAPLQWMVHQSTHNIRPALCGRHRLRSGAVGPQKEQAQASIRFVVPGVVDGTVWPREARRSRAAWMSSTGIEAPHVIARE